MGLNLKISLIHLDVHYKAPDHNRSNLIELNRKAAEKSQLLVNTEMAVSGYSFQSMEDIDGYVESATGPTLTLLKEIARTYGTYICIGFAEEDERTGIYYNAAHVIGPEGKTVCRYRKINAEARWACPGAGTQDNTFDTPWGRIGVLICSDTYHGLLPRQTALRGAKMILVPANWPASGIDPQNIWKARAMENGVYVVACNRSGRDRTMSCDNAWSCAFTPGGKKIVARCSSGSSIVSFQVTLKHGQLPGQDNRKKLETRKPELYRPIYLDMRHSDYGGSDFTSYYEMPRPGKFSVTSFAGESQQSNISESLLNEMGKKQGRPGFHCFLLPRIFDRQSLSIFSSQPALKKLPEHIAVFVGYKENNGETGTLLILFQGERHWYQNTHHEKSNISNNNQSFPAIVDMGPLRVGVCCENELVHPETAVACSKLGCDLLLVSAGSLDNSAPLVFGVKSVEQTAIAVAGKNMAFICEPPQGHQPWREKKILKQGVCRMTLHSKRTRKKRFQDRVDFDLLLTTKKV